MHIGQFDYFFKFHLTIKMDLVEVVYYLKFKHVFQFLSKLYDYCYGGGAITFPSFDRYWNVVSSSSTSYPVGSLGSLDAKWCQDAKFTLYLSA